MRETPHGSWLNETRGLLRQAIGKYLEGDPMTGRHIAAMRNYLRQWIESPDFWGPEIDKLRRSVDDLTSEEAIASWLDIALRAGIDPI